MHGDPGDLASSRCRAWAPETMSGKPSPMEPAMVRPATIPVCLNARFIQCSDTKPDGRVRLRKDHFTASVRMGPAGRPHGRGRATGVCVSPCVP